MRASICVFLVLAFASLAVADPRVEAQGSFDELSLTIDYLGIGASTVSGPTRRTLRVRADGRMQLERSHPLLRFPACRGRASRTEIDRLERLLPAQLPGAVGPKVSRPDPEGRSAFRLARKRGQTLDSATGLVSALEPAALDSLCKVLEGLARRLVAVQESAATRVQGRVLVRPLSGRFEVLVSTPAGEISVAEPFAAALRALKGYPVVLEGEVGVSGALEGARLLDPLPVRLKGQATRLGAKPRLRLGRGRSLQAVGPRRNVLGAARGHRVEVAGWRFASGLLLVDSVGAECQAPATARRREADVATHAQDAGLRVLHVSLTRGLALVQSTRGGRIGWVPRSTLRWSERTQLPPPEGSAGLVNALGR